MSVKCFKFKIKLSTFDGVQEELNLIHTVNYTDYEFHNYVDDAIIYSVMKSKHEFDYISHIKPKFEYVLEYLKELGFKEDQSNILTYDFNFYNKKALSQKLKDFFHQFTSSKE